MSDVKWGTPRWRDYMVLAGQVGEALTGMPVTVEAREPSAKDALAEMVPVAGPAAVIRIRPEIGGASWLHILLHELAHGVADYVPQGTSALAELPAGSVTIKSNQGQEVEADRRALCWERWASERQYTAPGSGDVILDKLEALKTLREYRKGG